MMTGLVFYAFLLAQQPEPGVSVTSSLWVAADPQLEKQTRCKDVLWAGSFLGAKNYEAIEICTVAPSEGTTCAGPQGFEKCGRSITLRVKCAGSGCDPLTPVR